MWKCPRCETHNDDNSTICVVCGTNNSMLRNLHDTPTETERQDDISPEPIIQKNIVTKSDSYSHDDTICTPLPDAIKLMVDYSSYNEKKIFLSLAVVFMLILAYFYLIERKFDLPSILVYFGFIVRNSDLPSIIPWIKPTASISR